ncbi:hypothetical protein SBA3_2190004 [Candidatus Sulfopaludibacter sp. SbA3]|nr:hypothetical protein SBA3_2190004 [Candidatus Sulfopaludibacter sp. SbA3]
MANEPRWTAGNHPTPEELLLAREDQLPHQDAEPILAHLHQCWECRAQVERFTRGIDTYLKFRKLHLDPVATPRPGGWLRLSARLRDAEDPAVHSQALWKRVPRGIWLAASLAAAAALLAMLFVSPAPLTAKMVLHRALRAEAAGTGTPSIQRVLVRRAGALVATDNFVLQRAYVDRSRPLSVASHLSWHDSLHTRQDSVTTTPNEIRVETKTPESAISLASLTVASADYQPRARHVELRDGITIDVETVAPASATPEAEAVPPAREAPPAPKSVPAAEDRAEDREALEMEVRWALRRIDADLGEPLQIQAAGDDLVVKGTLDEAARRDQIAEALRAFPRVSTQLSLAVPDAGLLGKAQPIDPSGAASSPLLSSQLSNNCRKIFPTPKLAARSSHKPCISRTTSCSTVGRSADSPSATLRPSPMPCPPKPARRSIGSSPPIRKPSPQRPERSSRCGSRMSNSTPEPSTRACRGRPLRSPPCRMRKDSIISRSVC